MIQLTRQSALQFARFALVGGVNTLVDLLVFNIAGYFFGLDTTVEYLLAKSLAFLVAMVNSYVLNSRFTFKQEGKGASWKRFAVITVASFVISTLVSGAVFSVLRNTIPAVLAGNISAIVGIGISMVTNFIGYKLFVFKKK